MFGGCGGFSQFGRFEGLSGQQHRRDAFAVADWRPGDALGGADVAGVQVVVGAIQPPGIQPFDMLALPVGDGGVAGVKLPRRGGGGADPQPDQQRGVDDAAMADDHDRLPGVLAHDAIEELADTRGEAAPTLAAGRERQVGIFTEVAEGAVALQKVGNVEAIGLAGT